MFLSSGNFRSIKFKLFWLFEYTVTVDNKLLATKKKGQSYFCIFS